MNRYFERVSGVIIAFYFFAPMMLLLLSMVCTIYSISILLNISVLAIEILMMMIILHDIMRKHFASALAGCLSAALIAFIFIYNSPAVLRNFFYKEIVVDRATFAEECKSHKSVKIEDFVVRSCALYDLSYMEQADVIIMIESESSNAEYKNSSTHRNDKANDMLYKLTQQYGGGGEELDRLRKLYGVWNSPFRYEFLAPGFVVLNFNLSAETR